MAIDREALTDYLAIEYDTLLAEAGIDGADTAEDLGPALDKVEVLVTLSEDLSPLWIEPLARYFTLDRIVNRFTANMAVSIRGDSYALQHQFANAMKRLEMAHALVSWIVEPLAPGGYGEITVVEMPFLTGCDYEAVET